MKLLNIQERSMNKFTTTVIQWIFPLKSLLVVKNVKRDSMRASEKNIKKPMSLGFFPNKTTFFSSSTLPLLSRTKTVGLFERLVICVSKAKSLLVDELLERFFR